MSKIVTDELIESLAQALAAEQDDTLPLLIQIQQQSVAENWSRYRFANVIKRRFRLHAMTALNHLGYTFP